MTTAILQLDEIIVRDDKLLFTCRYFFSNDFLSYDFLSRPFFYNR
ncbi:Uncharacterised protein [Salmonella enterica subsp. enterica]|nr:Uncharacterised protein [Salmonella enterica subsp. enterica]